MLEKLGEVLRKATDKIANAIFLDKNLLDSIIRDLQRAMIEADVNVLLVKELSDKIRKVALDERIKEIEKKEHVIKILHDELLKILGEHKELKLKKEQNRILLLGLYGVGKCVHAKSNVQLSDGNIVKIEDLYNDCKNNSELELEDGKIIDISNKNLLVPSFNPETLKIENKKVTHLWKLNKEGLMEISLDNGNDFSIKVTPEHPFFVLRENRVFKVRADEIRLDDYISIPREIRSSGKTIDLFEEIRKLNLYVYLNPEETNSILSSKNKSLKEINKILKFKNNYDHFTTCIKKGQVPIELFGENKYSFLKIKGHDDRKIITIPTYLTSEFAEFLGYIMGDGNIGKGYIQISNEDLEIISRVKKLSEILFSITPIIKRDFRTKKMYKILINSNSLIEVLSIFGLKRGKKGKQLMIPKQILMSNEEVIRMFIRAYFDCDSSPSEKKRFIELCSESNILIKQMSLLLMRFGILPITSKKIIKNIPYWRLCIKARYAEAYANKIGYLIERKRKIIEEYKKIGVIQGAGNQDMIPLGKAIKELRTKLGFSIGEIQAHAVNSYGIYEEKGFISRENLLKLVTYYQLKKKGVFLDVLNKIDNNNLGTSYHHGALNSFMHSLRKEEMIIMNEGNTKLGEKGRLYLQSIDLGEFQNLLTKFGLIAESDVCWIPIKDIKNIKNDEKFVYDLTVEDNHSFIADGFIVHNTTTVAKLGNYYAKRGNKVAVIGLDVHRPAASEQLKQLAEKNKLTYFVDMDEKDPVKIWKKNKKKLEDYNVVIVDTAGRHSLDKDLINEIKKLNKEIEPTESVLVMPADIGQAAKQQASDFKKAVDISGVIITRMDSTAKGGGALTACNEVKTGVYFITTGEKINDIEEFNPKSFLSRLLGMGDLEALIEKVKSATDSDKQEKLKKKIEEGKINIEDFIEQIKSMNSLGGFGKLKEMIPGLGSAKIPEEALETQQAKTAKWEHIVKSMTKEEKENPELLEKQTQKIGRIAKGAGVNNSDVRALLKQYKLLTEMMKSGIGADMESGQLSQKQMMKLAKKFSKVKHIRF